jgi:hypothetical protein
MASGAVIIMARRGAGAREDSMGRDDEDDLPEFLKKFPESASILKDIQLGVLFGRQVQ